MESESKGKVLAAYEAQGVVIAAGQQVYLTYPGEDERPHRSREFTMMDTMEGCLLVGASPDVPPAEPESKARVFFPVTESRPGYTFESRIIGKLAPADDDRRWVIQKPRPESVRSVVNRRREIRVTTKWDGAIAWKRDSGSLNVPVTVRNLSFGGCCISIDTKHIRELGNVDAVLSLLEADVFTLSLRPPDKLVESRRGGKKRGTAPQITDEDLAPYRDIPALVLARAPKVQDGEKVELISLEFPAERQAINRLMAAAQHEGTLSTE